MTTPCYYCEEDRATACRVCIHGYDGTTPEEVTAWKRDAARYRWLRDSEEGVEFRDGRGRWRADCPSGADLDAAIDAALRAAAAARTKC